MRVTVCDPQGPRAWRSLPYVAPMFLLVLAVIFATAYPPAAWLLGLASFAFFQLIGMASPNYHPTTTAELSCGAGFVELETRAPFKQRIRAKDITGATTARTPTGVNLTLQHRKRRQPITLSVDTDADAAKIRQALGIGHGGFGAVAWSMRLHPVAIVAFAGRLMAASIALLAMIVTLVVSSNAGLAVGFGLGQFAFIGAIMGFIGLMVAQPEPTIVMAADGLRLKMPRGWFSLPYGAIEGVEETSRGLVFKVPPPYGTIRVDFNGPNLGGPNDQDRELLVSQIVAASQRARGMGPYKDDVAGRIDALRRTNESFRDWLARLDMAGQTLSAGAGYRGHTFAPEDLWSVLEDPEADVHLRAAAARVLRHSTELDTRVRIDAALATVRDETAQRRLRIAIDDDIEDASQELASLDAVEHAAVAMPPHPMTGR